MQTFPSRGKCVAVASGPHDLDPRSERPEPAGRHPVTWLLALALAAGGPPETAAVAVEQAAPGWPRVIARVEVTGISWTKEFVVLRELPWKPGDTVDEATWELGTTRLWNTDLFSRIEARVELRDGAFVARYELEERFSLNPLLSFGAGGGKWWLRVGANDVNWFGRYLEWGVRYERFDVYNGGQGWLRDPRLFGRRLMGLVQLDYLFRPRPQYTRRRLGGTAEVFGELDDWTRAGVRLEVFRDEYLAPLEGDANLPPGLVAGQLTGLVRVGRVDTVRLRQKGWSLELRETLGLPSSGLLYSQTMLEFLGFALVGARWNLALRAQAALSSEAPTELQYWLGGLDLVRGYADSLVRTRAFALANAEARVTLFDSMWFAVQLAGFVDGAVAEQGGVKGLLSAGGGVRLLVPRLVKTGARADVAVTLLGRPEVGVSLGVFQFF